MLLLERDEKPVRLPGSHVSAKEKPGLLMLQTQPEEPAVISECLVFEK